MKKFLFLTITILFAAAGFFYYKTVFHSNAVDLSQFLPENALVLINQKDFGEIRRRYNSRPIAESLEQVDVVKIALDIGVSFNKVEQLRNIRDFLRSKTFQLLFEEFLQEDFSVALLSGKLSDDYAEYLKKHILVACKPAHHMQIYETIGKITRYELDHSSSTYGNHAVNRITINEGSTLFYVKIKSYILVGFDLRTMHKALDRYDETDQILAENEYYKKFKKKHKGSQLFIYSAIKHIIDRIHEYQAINGDHKSNIVNMLKKWKGFRAGALFSQGDEFISRSTVELHFDENDLTHHVAELLKHKPTVDTKLNTIPQDAILYYWANTFDMDTMWKIFKNESGIDEFTKSELESSIEQLTGTTFQNLLDLIGSEVHIILRKHSPSDYIPVPNFTLLIRVNERKKSEKIIDTFFTRNKIPHGHGWDKNIRYTYWGEEKQRGLQPVYAFLDDYLLISSSIAMHKSVIKTISDRNNLTHTQNFALIGGNLFLDSNSIFFIQTEDFIELTKELVNWGGAMMALKNRDTAYKSKVLIDHFIQPLLDGLKMYTAFSTRSYNQEDALHIEVQTLIAD